jgi:hypothetical protein
LRLSVPRAAQQNGICSDANQDEVFENSRVNYSVANLSDHLFLGKDFDRRKLVASRANVKILILFGSQVSIVSEFFFFRAESCHDYSDEKVAHK